MKRAVWGATAAAAIPEDEEEGGDFVRRMFFIGGMAAALCAWSVSVQASIFTTNYGDGGTACGQTLFSPTPLLGQTATCSGTGSLQFQVDLTGHAGPGLGLGHPPDINTADLSVYGNPGIGFTVNTQGNETLTGAIPFTFGVAFQFGMYLLAHAELGAGASTVFSQTDFYNTAVLAPFTVLDSTGVALSGVSALSDTGYSYQIQTPFALPEPASLLLLVTGLAGLAVVRRGRKANAQRRFAN